MSKIQLTEDQAFKLADIIFKDLQRHNISMQQTVIIGLWREAGYIKEELKPCPVCKKLPYSSLSNNDTLEICCDNKQCMLYRRFFNLNDWNKRV